MPIINGLNNNVGIHIFDTTINQAPSVPGRGDILYHTNGTVYCVWSQINSNNLYKSIYLATSTDNGNNYQNVLQLTASFWDDDPCLIQLDLGSSSSDLGIVFNRETVSGTTTTLSVYRFTINTMGIITSPLDSIGLTGVRYLCVEHLSVGSYIIAGLPIGGRPNIWKNLTGFTTNNWTILHNFNSSEIPIIPLSFKFRLLSNGDYAVILVCPTVVNGLTGNTPILASIIGDVYFLTSNTNCSTWGSIQNVTNYSGSPSFNLLNLSSAIDADLCQLSDTTLSIAFQETFISQFLSASTTPSFVDTLNITVLGYHSSYNLLLIGTGQGNNSPSGFYTFNLSTGATRHYYTGSGINPLWNDQINHISVSLNSRFIALSTTNSIEIFDTNPGADPNTWTHTTLRNSTTPSLHSNPSNILFQDNSNLFVGWTGSSVSGNAVSIIDCANIAGGFTDLITDTPGSTNICDSTNTIFYNAGVLRFTSGARIYHDDIAGNIVYSTNIGLSSTIMGCYDDVNTQWYIVYGNSVIKVTDSGSSFSATHIPAMETVPEYLYAIPGNGMLVHYRQGSDDINLGSGFAYWSFITNTFSGVFASRDEPFLQKPFIDPELLRGIQLNNIIIIGNWLLGTTGTVDSNNIRAINLDNVGRYRHGIFPYNSVTQQITLGGNFYDMTDSNFGIQYNKIMFLRHIPLPDNTLIVFANKYAYNYGLQPFAAFTAKMQPNVHLISCRARIKAKSTRVISCRARVLNTTTQSILCRARIAHMQCIKIKAHIAGRPTQTLQCKASILGKKGSSFQGIFNIQVNSLASLRGIFSITNGIIGLQTIAFKATIARTIVKQFTGHFTISPVSFNGLVNTITNSANFNSSKVLGIKGRIS